MNPLGGPKVGWRVLVMFLCFTPTLVLFQFSHKAFLIHRHGTLIVYVLKLVHTTMLE
jgi:hypothetical protein